MAAQKVQKESDWAENSEVQKLKFSNKWVKKFLIRGKMSRRKITKEDKDVPTETEIKRILGIGQNIYVQKGHSPESCFNFDETAVTYAIGPTHVYCPKDQNRATHVGVSDAKVRITATIAVNSIGHFAPTMFIIKHSVSSEKRPDQTKMRVIPDFLKKNGFTPNDGWEMKTWVKELTIKNKTDVHKVNYLIHNVSGHVITSQVKAWNDTVRMCMWFEIIILPIRNKLGKMLIWCDNCGSHLTQAVKTVITECDVDVAYLPKNMTAELQVLDLVVNGPLKAHIRNKRAMRLYNAFQEYKVQRQNDSHLVFTAPRPSMIEGIRDLILLFEEQFTHEKFRSCINRSFIATGTLPVTTLNDVEVPEFKSFKRESACGTMSIIPKGTWSRPIPDDIVNRIEIASTGESSVNEEERTVETAIFEFYSANDVDLDNCISDDDDDDDE